MANMAAWSNFQHLAPGMKFRIRANLAGQNVSAHQLARKARGAPAMAAHEKAT